MLFFYFLLENSATIINKNMNHNDIAGIYKAFQSTFLTEGKENNSVGTKNKKGRGGQSLPVEGKKGNKDKGFAGLGKKEKGPKVEGIKEPMEELKRKKTKRAENVKNVKNVENPKKMPVESINTDMRNNLFDRLYEEVMDDDNAALDTGTMQFRRVG
jgi:hypothetical protein